MRPIPTIGLAQMRVIPGDIEANLERAVELIEEAASQQAELVLLPEMCLSGLCEEMADLAQTIPGPATDRLADAARETGAWVVAGMPEANPCGSRGEPLPSASARPGEKPFNVAVAISPTGEVAAVYRKVFLYLQEKEGFTAGTEACLLDLGFCQASLTICYDYIFPEYIRRLALAGARLILHPTAWVDTEICRQWHYPAAEAYRAQCMVRALENGVFLASANIVGPYDAEGYLEGVGGSAIIAPWGEVLAEVAEGEGVAVAELDFSLIEQWSEAAAPYLKDYERRSRRAIPTIALSGGTHHARGSAFHASRDVRKPLRDGRAVRPAVPHAHSQARPPLRRHAA